MVQGGDGLICLTMKLRRDVAPVGSQTALSHDHELESNKMFIHNKESDLHCCDLCLTASAVPVVSVCVALGIVWGM